MVFKSRGNNTNSSGPSTSYTQVALAGVPGAYSTFSPYFTYSNGTAGVGATITAVGTGGLDIDGYGTTVGERVLITGFPSPYAYVNGIYTITVTGQTSGTHFKCTRSTDFDTSAQMIAGNTVYVSSGNTNAGATFTLSASVPTVGTSAVTFTENPVAGSTAYFKPSSSAYVQIAPSEFVVSGIGTYVSGLSAGNTTINGTFSAYSGSNYMAELEIGNNLTVSGPSEFLSDLYAGDDNFYYSYSQAALEIGYSGMTFPGAISSLSNTPQTIYDPTISVSLEFASQLSPPSPYASQTNPTLGIAQNFTMSEVVSPSGAYTENGTYWTGTVYSYDGNSVSSYSSNGGGFTDGGGVSGVSYASAAEDTSSSGYTEPSGGSGDLYEFYVYCYFYIPSTGYTVVNPTPYYCSFTSGTSGLSFGIDFTCNNLAAQSSGFFITRQINSSGYNDGYNFSGSGSFTDTNSGWTTSLSQANILSDFGNSIAFNILYTWSGVGPTNNYPSDFFIVLDNYSSSQYWDTGLSGTYSQSITDSVGFGNYGNPLPGSLYGDYYANNVTRYYEAFGEGSDPLSNLYFSPTYTSYQMTDDNSGNLYQVYHTNLYPSPVRVLGDPTGNPYYDYYFDTNNNYFTENSLSWTYGSTVTPTQYGYQANGSTLNITYTPYNESTLGDITVYSPGLNNASVTDPGDNNYYYVAIYLSNASSTFKILRSGDQGGAEVLAATGSTVDLSYLPWNGNSTVTPNSYLKPAGWFAKDTASFSDSATLVVQSTDPSTPNPYIEFVDSNANNLFLLGFDHAYDQALLQSESNVTIAAASGNNATLTTGAGTALLQSEIGTAEVEGDSSSFSAGPSGFGMTTFTSNNPAWSVQLGGGYPFLSWRVYASGLTITNPGYGSFLTLDNAGISAAGDYTGTWTGAVIGSAYGGAGSVSGIMKANGSGTVSAAAAGTDYLAPFGSETANYFYAAPNGSAGNPSFRAIVAADIPTLNQNTTGSAATLTTSRTINGVSFNGSANILAPTESATPTALTPGTSVALALTASLQCQNFTLTPGQNFTLANPSNLSAGMEFKIAFTQDATGSRVITWGSAYKFPGGTKFVLSTAASAKDLVYFYSPDGTNIYCNGWAAYS